MTLRVKLKKEQRVNKPSAFPSGTFSVHNHTVSLPAHRQRLVSVQSILSQPRQGQVHYNGTNSRNSSLEKDRHQRKLFEYFLVVSLQKSKAGAHYLPEVTQQFPPKVSSSVSFTTYYTRRVKLERPRN